MAALADLTPKELRDRRRALKATVKRRVGAIFRAKADLSEAQLLLSAVQREIERRDKLAKGNQRTR